jgi:cytoskeletal protein CcmA (bactofilin family)
MFLNIGTVREHLTARAGGPAWPESASDTYTVIHADLVITGDLRTDGHIEVNGRIEGTSNSRSILVREDGWIEGTILADIAEIRGTVVGAVRATTVIIGSNARVHGSIFHNSLTIEPGAQLEGRRPWRPHVDRNQEPDQ